MVYLTESPNCPGHCAGRTHLGLKLCHLLAVGCIYNRYIYILYLYIICIHTLYVYIIYIIYVHIIHVTYNTYIT